MAGGFLEAWENVMVFNSHKKQQKLFYPANTGISLFVPVKEIIKKSPAEYEFFLFY